MYKSNKRWKLMMLSFCAMIFSLSGYAAAESLQDCAKKGDLERVKFLITLLEDASEGFIPKSLLYCLIANSNDFLVTFINFLACLLILPTGAVTDISV